MSAVEVNTHFEFGLADQTVRKRLRERGIKSFLRKKKPLISKENEQKRMDWCRAHKAWTTEDWEMVL